MLIESRSEPTSIADPWTLYIYAMRSPAYYKDTFTLKAWQSHSTAIKSKEELEQIDMLPQLKGKLFLTAELSAMFTKKEDDLVEKVDILNPIDRQFAVNNAAAISGCLVVVTIHE